MKKTITIVILILVSLITVWYLFKNKKNDSQPISMSSDSLSTTKNNSYTVDSINKIKEFNDSIENKIFNIPERNLNLFDKTNNDLFDNYLLNFSTKPNLTVKSNLEICGGDYCYSIRKWSNLNQDTILVYSKGDAGEYGLDNSQYIIINGEINWFRNFKIGIEDFGSETKPTIYKSTEDIITPVIGGYTISKREKKYSDFAEFKFKNEKFNTTNVKDEAFFKNELKDLEESFNAKSEE